MPFGRDMCPMGTRKASPKNRTEILLRDLGAVFFLNYSFFIFHYSLFIIH